VFVLPQFPDILAQDALYFHFKDTDTAYKQQLLTIKRGISCDCKDADARDWVEALLCAGGLAFDDSVIPSLTPEAMMNRCASSVAFARFQEVDFGS
jgi:hypothetical protein